MSTQCNIYLYWKYNFILMLCSICTCKVRKMTSLRSKHVALHLELTKTLTNRCVDQRLFDNNCTKDKWAFYTSCVTDPWKQRRMKERLFTNWNLHCVFSTFLSPLHKEVRNPPAHPPVIYSMKASRLSALLCGLLLGQRPVKRFLLKTDPISRWSFRSLNGTP